MFQARFEQCSSFKKIVDSIKQLVKNVNIDITQQGMSIQAIDTCHIALVAVKLKIDCFNQYNCIRPLTIGISIENVAKILKMAGNNDSLTISCEYEEPTELRFRFQTKGAEKITEFSLSLMVIDTQSMGIPETQYSSITSMPSSQFTRICKQLGSLSENIKIQTNKQNIKFSIVGQIGSGSTVLRQNQKENQDEAVLLSIDQPTTQNFASRYLSIFSKAGSISDQVTINMSDSTPMKITYKLFKGKGQLSYYLAPKVTQEDN